MKASSALLAADDDDVGATLLAACCDDAADSERDMHMVAKACSKCLGEELEAGFTATSIIVARSEVVSLNPTHDQSMMTRVRRI